MSGQRKWRPIPPPPPPEVVLEERIGPHLVHIERFEHESSFTVSSSSAGGIACATNKTTMYRAIQICGNSRSMIGVSAQSAEAALLQAARGLGYEPDEKERP